MHIQYLLNLGIKTTYSYTGSGQNQLTGSASYKININKNLTTLQFKPYDIGYDINANEWKILEIFGVNGKFVYKTCNGSTIKYFNQEDLFSITQITQVYNNKVDVEIDCLISKYQDLLV